MLSPLRICPERTDISGSVCYPFQGSDCDFFMLQYVLIQKKAYTISYCDIVSKINKVQCEIQLLDSTLNFCVALYHSLSTHGSHPHAHDQLSEHLG